MSKLPFHKLPGASSLNGLVVANLTNAATSLQLNLTAVVPPTVNDDSGSGYAVGSLWLDTATNVLWYCMDASVGAALWANLGSYSQRIGENKTSNYVVTVADFGKLLIMNHTSTRTFTLPSIDSSHLGNYVDFYNRGSGRLNIDAVDTDTIDESTTAPGSIYTLEAKAAIRLQVIGPADWGTTAATKLWSLD